METVKGIMKKAQKIVIYGPEGIGKSSFLSKLPGTIFIDVEGSTALLDVERTKKPSSWTMVLDQIQEIKQDKLFQTIAIDTADWAEKLCSEHVCSKANMNGIESFGYGKGYTYLEEEFGKFLNILQDVVDSGINVAFAAHATMRKIERPEETGAYDRWELKLQKKTAPLLKEWADMVLFADYEIHVVNVDGQGAQKGKNKAQGGKRVMYTCHTPYWDAKNRHGLEYKLDFSYDKIAHCIPVRSVLQPETPVVSEPTKKDVTPAPEVIPNPEPIATSAPPTSPPTTTTENEDIMKPLLDLMDHYGVTHQDIQKAVAQKGYYPITTPISKYDKSFISGVLVAAWDKVHGMIIDIEAKETGVDVLFD